MLCWPERLLACCGVSPYTPYMRLLLVPAWIYPVISLSLAIFLEGVSGSDRAGWIWAGLVAVEAAAGLRMTFDVQQRRDDEAVLRQHWVDALELLQQYGDLPRFCALVARVAQQLEHTLGVAGGVA